MAHVETLALVWILIMNALTVLVVVAGRVNPKMACPVRMR